MLRTIDQGTQIGMILESLPSDFNQIKRNYITDKLSYNQSELLNELSNFQTVLTIGTGEANVATTIPKKKNERKGVKNTRTCKHKGKKRKNNTCKKFLAKPRGSCFNCNEPGH